MGVEADDEGHSEDLDDRRLHALPACESVDLRLFVVADRVEPCILHLGGCDRL